MNKPDNYNKHLTLDERIIIQNLLDANVNLTQIGIVLNKHRTTISKEIKVHRHDKEPRSHSYTLPACAKSTSCNRFCEHRCRASFCKEYEEPACPKILKAPFVCNGCTTKQHCRFRRFYYTASVAQAEYNYMLSDSRSGILLPPENVYEIEKVISPLILDKSQSINQVYTNHPDIHPFSKPTFYKYINEGLFSVRNIDLPRKVKYKKRKSNTLKVAADTAIRKGRTYADYQTYMKTHPFSNVVQMDTVIGSLGCHHCFLTLLFINCHLMLIIPLKAKTMDCVTSEFVRLKKLLGNDIFHKLFEVVLTDNGPEFYDPISIEANFETGEQSSHVFYCDPQASWQKPHIEKNHEYIRYVLPKGSTFAGIDYDKCCLLASHINSVPRDSLNGKTPYELASLYLGEEILEKFDIKRIEADDVCLKPSLLKNINQ